MRKVPHSFVLLSKEYWLWLGRVLGAMVTIVAPGVVYIAVAVRVDGNADQEYFAVVAQIIPIMFLALAIEERYFFRNPRLPQPPSFPDPLPAEMPKQARLFKFAPVAFKIYMVLAYAYPVVILGALVLAEITSLHVLATGDSTSADLDRTAAGLGAAFLALIFSALFASIGRPSMSRAASREGGGGSEDFAQERPDD